MTQRVDVGERAVYVGIRIDPAPEPNRIALHIPPEARVVIAEVVVDFRAPLPPLRLITAIRVRGLVFELRVI